MLSIRLTFRGTLSSSCLAPQNLSHLWHSLLPQQSFSVFSLHCFLECPHLHFQLCGNIFSPNSLSPSSSQESTRLTCFAWFAGPCLVRCFCPVTCLPEVHLSSVDLRNYLERFPPEYDSTPLAQPFIPHHQRQSGNKVGMETAPHSVSGSFLHCEKPHSPQVRMTYVALSLQFFLGSHIALAACDCNWLFSACLSFKTLSFMKTKTKDIPPDYGFIPTSQPKDWQYHRGVKSL